MILGCAAAGPEQHRFGSDNAKRSSSGAKGSLAYPPEAPTSKPPELFDNATITITGNHSEKAQQATAAPTQSRIKCSLPSCSNERGPPLVCPSAAAEPSLDVSKDFCGICTISVASSCLAP